MKFLFFFLGVPMMIMSFFQAADVLPYVQQYNILVGGQVVEISAEQQQQLQMQVDALLQNTRTMPAFGVTLPQDLEADQQENVYVCLKFDKTISVNDLPFDELCFRVDKDCHGFNLHRGNNGVFQGRAIYLEILEDGTMNDLYKFATQISAQQPSQSQSQTSAKSQQDIAQTQSQTSAKDIKRGVAQTQSQTNSEDSTQDVAQSQTQSQNPLQ